MTMRSCIALCLSLLLLLPAGGAHAQDSAGVDTIRAEYHDMLDLFYRPLDPHELLQAGWTALGNDAHRHGAAGPDALPALQGDADAAVEAFASVSSSYLTHGARVFSR